MTNPKPRQSTRRLGFSLIELLAVIAIIAILALISYPMLTSSRQDMTIRSSSRQLETLMEKARTMAINQKKPMRVVINCVRPAGADNCYADLQTAVYADKTVTGWQLSPPDRRVFDSVLRIVKTDPSAVFDGEISVPNIFWTIFTPAGNIFSDPRGFEIFLYHSSQKLPEKKGYKISINSFSGYISSETDTFTPIP